MAEEKFEEVFPEASRIMEGLRDTGYDYNTAMTDIIDNSIAANATKVVVKAEEDLDGDIRVTIADNGSGMTGEELVEAMRYGSAPRRTIHSLGKFGLGLKTASTSCCRRLKVISRKDGTASCAVWDLDYIAKTGKWRLLIPEPSMEELNELDECAGEGNGTLVVWEECDRLLSARYSNPTTKAFRDAFSRSNKVLRHYIAMVYQRFLDSADQRAENVQIELNGELVAPWDPFCKELHEDYGSQEIEVEESGGKTIKVASYIVPPKHELNVEERQRVMPSEDKDLKVFGEESLSGFYVYRENRLIHWGDWFGMPGIDFHHKLCRFELDFSAELDEQFQVDIKKSRILLDPNIRDRIIDIVNPIKKEGARIFRSKERGSIAKKARKLHDESNSVLAEKATGLVSSTIVETGEGEAEITNKFGTITVPYGIVSDAPSDRSFVQVEDGLQDGLLWEPALINKKPGVRLNSSHEFYKRFYGVAKNNPVVSQAMDYVFWVLAQAESEALGKTAEENLEEARYAASKKLRKLADELPEVSEEDFEE